MLAGIVRSVSSHDGVSFGDLRRDLCELAAAFIAAAQSTPFGLTGGPAKLTRDQRTRWLRSNIQGPADRLIDALSETNIAMLSEWPEAMNSPAPDKARLTAELSVLRERVTELIAQLDERKADRSDFITEFRTDLANALTTIFERHFPRHRAARNAYDKTTAAESPYAAFLRLCAEEIFPYDKGLSGRIIDDVTKMRGSR